MTDFKYIEGKIKEFGASKVAFADLSGVIPDGLEHLRYAVSIAVRLSDAIINQIEDKPTHTYFHHYRSVNTLIDNITLKTSLLIQDLGYLALAVPASQTVKTQDDSYTGIFQHKTAARMSGIGWIGKNGLLITPEFGPRVRLGTVLTNMELPINNTLYNGGCGDCQMCKIACPAMAICGNEWHEGLQRSDIIDAEACSRYMNEKFKHIGRGSVCGVCIRVCPKGHSVLGR